MAFVYKLARDSRKICRIPHQNNSILRFNHTQSLDSFKKFHTFRFVEDRKTYRRIPFSYIFNFEFKNTDYPKLGQPRTPLSYFSAETLNLSNSIYSCKNKTIRLAIKKRRKRLGERVSLRYR